VTVSSTAGGRSNSNVTRRNRIERTDLPLREAIAREGGGWAEDKLKAFGPVEVWDRIDEVWRPEVLEVTENLEEILRGRDLRGEVWLLTRPYVKGNSDPVNGQLLEKLDPRTLRKAFDIVPILTRNFRPVHKLLLGACNPNPPRVYLEPSTGAPPKLPADLIPDEPRPPSPAEQKKIKEMLAELRGTGTRKEKDGARAHEGNGHSHDQAGRNGR